MKLVTVLTALLLCATACSDGGGGDKDVDSGVDIKPCLPQCEGKECGPDGCEDFCGFCQSGYKCQEGTCEVECIPACAGVECGDGGCGVSCGACADGMKCEEGECVADCTDDCSYGQSGCDGAFRLVCGYHDEDPCLDWSPPESCPPESPCTDGECLCPTDCEGKECGSDGCGNQCGTCNPLGSCSDGLCVCNWGACKDGDNLTEVCENKELKLSDKGFVQLECPSLPLIQGKFLVTIAFHDTDGVTYDWQDKKFDFFVQQSNNDSGLVALNFNFSSL